MSAPDEETALLGLAPVAPDRTVAYGPHPDQIVDFYAPPPAAVTARAARCGPVVLLHGGFWRAAYDRRHLSPLAAELARQGLLVALAEYRRVGAGGGAPRTFEDVAAAIGTVAAESRAGPGSGRGTTGRPRPRRALRGRPSRAARRRPPRHPAWAGSSRSPRSPTSPAPMSWA